jgi:hypothetical protein
MLRLPSGARERRAPGISIDLQRRRIMSTKEKREKTIKVSDEILKGCYANTLFVTHTVEEFVLDFVLSLPPQGVINSRVIISPGHLKRIIKALKQNLAAYEERHGPLSEAPDPGVKSGDFIH